MHDGFYGEQVYSDNLWDWVDYKQINEPGLENLSIHYLNLHGPSYECPEAGPSASRATCACTTRVSSTTSRNTRARSPSSTWTMSLIRTTGSTMYSGTHLRRGRCRERPGRHLDRKTVQARVLRRARPFEDNLTYEILSDFEGTFTPAGKASRNHIGSGFSDWGSLLCRSTEWYAKLHGSVMSSCPVGKTLNRTRGRR